MFIAGVAIVASVRAAPLAMRVVLADPDPELHRALATSLAPWRIEIVVDPSPPDGEPAAEARADERGAQFVVWRDGDQLAVYDRRSGATERRPIRVGAFDAIEAAAAALTVKTMMRLPAPDPVASVAAPASPSGVEFRIEGGAGSRYEHGLDSNVALRFAVAAEIRPWRERGWRFGVLADFGGSADVNQAGFKGTWSNVAGLALASWAYQREQWEVGPWLALGVEHSSLDGTEMMAARNESATLFAARGGAIAHYRIGFWTIGAIAGVETLPSTQTYTKMNSPAQVFEIPPFGLIAELVVGADIAP